MQRRFGLKTFKEKRFEKGTMFVHPQLDRRGALEAHIAKHEFLEVPEAARRPTHNKRYRVYDFHLPVVSRDVILKVSWSNPQYTLGRRINICVSQWFKNYAKVAFLGALELDGIGVNTIAPLACWRYRRTWLYIDNYLLYEKLPALESVLDFADELRVNPTETKKAALNALIDQMADTMRCIHDHGLRHDDVAIGNFLVQLADPDAPESEPMRRYGVALIDTDHVTRSRLKSGKLKQLFDLRDLRRLNLDFEGQRRFCMRYMGDEFSENWWRVYLFWSRWGKHPVRALLRGLVGRHCR